ncbi:putative ATP-dependent RNA helicase DHX33 [Lingula anatina]|uniref:RNA helicase n=1 Tax=Lingula anatina TaxID=7574 RepID=A0A1S3J0N4_LINAN|nr:putative ATP-dependent RNA helicase DHX33 [Lingula anatina]|eukprot:XP_013403823.1 putative ATP-dependent RNA helicase DHX33 [Lingula anatina]
MLIVAFLFRETRMMSTKGVLGSPKPAKRVKLTSVEPTRDELLEERKKLPIFPAKGKLLQNVQQVSTAIIIGETGCGKTTQIPQFLYKAGMHRNHTIAITQPRRVAAISIAERVSKEMGTELGQTVGYCVRFEDVSCQATKIRFMTDGMLLRESTLDPLLKRYSFVILDEAHERTVHTDVLFGVVKGAQKRRRAKGLPQLKILVMSATMDVDQFSQYFDCAPVFYLEGRQYPIQVKYSVQSQSDYLFSALVAVMQIHQEAPLGQDILVFLTGQEEIESAVHTLRDIVKDVTKQYAPMIVCPMYAALPTGQQMRIFQPTPGGVRKVIVATNIAETSVTIPNIKFVVDTGMVKAKIFNPNSGLDMLKVCWVSKSQAWQRTGRAGREAPGTCYRLYTEEEFEQFSTNTIPEIQRCNLSSVILQLLALGISDIVHFDFMDKPRPEAILAALDQLVLLGAVEKQEKVQLTLLGRQLAAFPLDPRLSRVLLGAKEFDCLEEMLTVVSLLSVESVFHTPYNKRDTAHAARQKFISSEGDHLTLLNVYRAYKGVKGDKQWCQENFINARNMQTASQIRKQLREICVHLQLPFKSCGQNTGVIRKCLCHGFFTNAAELQHEGVYKTVASKKTVVIHPSSSLFMRKPGCVIYNELVQTSKCYMRNLSVVDPQWLYEAAPTYFKRKKTAN